MEGDNIKLHLIYNFMKVNTQVLGQVVSNVDQSKANKISQKNSSKAVNTKINSTIDDIINSAQEGVYSVEVKLSNTGELQKVVKYLKDKKFGGAYVTYAGAVYLKIYWGPNKKLKRPSNKNLLEEDMMTIQEWTAMMKKRSYVNEKGDITSAKYKPI